MSVRPIRGNAKSKLSPPYATKKDLDRITTLLTTGKWSYGPKAKELERRIAELLDVPPEWVIATDSCTTALAAAGRLIAPQGGVAPGNGKLRVCPLTWPSTYSWCHDEGDQIEWVDCDDEGWPVSEVDVGVDLWGRALPDSCPVSILDAAHRFGDAEHGGYLREGAVQAVCYSFAPQKEIASFQGGALVSPRLPGSDVPSYLHAGTRDRVYCQGGGVKGLISDPAAMLAYRNMTHHDELKEARQKLLQEYYENLGDSMLTRPGEASGHLAVLDCGSPKIKHMVELALSRGPKIAYGHHYPLNEEQREACPNAAALSDRIITLPMHPALSRTEVVNICRRVRLA